MSEVRYSWTQPVCLLDWDLRHPDRPPVRIKVRDNERCVDCGKQTQSGIYIRVDPSTANFPSLTKDDA